MDMKDDCLKCKNEICHKKQVETIVTISLIEEYLNKIQGKIKNDDFEMIKEKFDKIKKIYLKHNIDKLNELDFFYNLYWFANEIQLLTDTIYSNEAKNLFTDDFYKFFDIDKNKYNFRFIKSNYNKDDTTCITLYFDKNKKCSKNKNLEIVNECVKRFSKLKVQVEAIKGME